MRHPGRDAGAITAEFAVVIPAVFVVLAVALTALHLEVVQLRLQAATFDAARLIGRGDGGATAVLQQVDPDARFAIRHEDSVACVDAVVPVRMGILVGLTLGASACALDDVQP
jgi:Flp pilus assembly protein TadG